MGLREDSCISLRSLQKREGSRISCRSSQTPQHSRWVYPVAVAKIFAFLFETYSGSRRKSQGQVLRNSKLAKVLVESLRARILCNLRPLVAPSKPQELSQEAPGGICVICKPARRPASPRARILCNLRGQVDLRKPQKLSQLVFCEGKAAPGSQRIVGDARLGPRVKGSIQRG